MSYKKIYINPDVLRWARLSAHLELYDIPKSIVATEKLIKIENGQELPTFGQLQKLAKKYERSLGTLLGDSIPELDYQPIPFFRKENKTYYDSSLALFIRDIIDKQDWARNYLISEGNIALDFIGSISINDDIENAALQIIKRLNIPSYTLFNNNEDFLKAIRNELEEHGIFISITGSSQSNKSISIEQAQGFAISDSIAPFVFVNTKNTTNAKIFTLLHEIVHLFLNVTGISEDVIRYRLPECNEDKIENFCNDVSAEILMPKADFLSNFNSMKGTIQYKISKLSKTFWVSELSICVRLWRLKLISFDEYSIIYSKIEKQIQEYFKDLTKKRKEQKGGNYYNNQRLKNGMLFSSLVYSAYKSGDILSLDLSCLLRIRTNNIENYFAKI